MNRYWLTHDSGGYWIVDMQTQQWYSFGPDIEAVYRKRDRLNQEGEMRDGEIVRTIDGHIARVSQLDWGIDEAEVGSYGWYTINSLGIVTVAELFEAAGCPIPADCIYAEATGSLAAFREISPDDCGNRQAHRFLLETIHTASESRHEWVHDGTWRPNRLIDLSRLPALDAWDARQMSSRRL
jgi:hypothetical protein